jgi:N-acetylglutamate synthase-like GNAT family acetyltransferase
MFEAPASEDWPTILQLANTSVANVPPAGQQDEWLTNRQDFASKPGAVQRHFVARDSESGRVVGYGSLEHDPQAPADAFRLFVVTDPADLESIGNELLEHALSQLDRLGAKTAWFTEYADDTSLLGFARARGFEPVRSFDWRGSELLVLEKKLVRS